MKLSLKIIFLPILLITLNCSNEPKQISFTKDIQPILEDRCIYCHSSDGPEGNIVLEDYQSVFSSRYKNHTTPMIVPGNPQTSRLYIVVSTRNTSMRMPPERLGEDPLSEDEVKIIHTWIEQGAQEN
ncbi:MAG: hypothetical protein H6627_00230 [Calditrichae bacterium]|nr:hypothetical protein [Calditrichota bacterium]MCB9056965.1 hypothetical protein [Calditrichia bacterium]